MKELEKSDLMIVNGGNQPAATYLTEQQIDALGDALIYSGAFVVGFFCGLLGIKSPW